VSQARRDMQRMKENFGLIGLCLRHEAIHCRSAFYLSASALFVCKCVYGVAKGVHTGSSSSSVDQLDAGCRPLCPIHCAKQIPITKQNQNC